MVSDREHHGIRAVHHRVGDIGDLSACRARVLHHGLKHLRRADDRGAGEVALLDHHLLGYEHLHRKQPAIDVRRALQRAIAMTPHEQATVYM